MKATGIVRRTDELGRIVIPKEIRRTYGIKDYDPLEIFTDDEAIILKPYKGRCKQCGSEDDLLHIGEITICRTCANAIKAAVEG